MYFNFWKSRFASHNPWIALYVNSLSHVSVVTSTRIFWYLFSERLISVVRQTSFFAKNRDQLSRLQLWFRIFFDRRSRCIHIFFLRSLAICVLKIYLDKDLRHKHSLPDYITSNLTHIIDQLFHSSPRNDRSTSNHATGLTKPCSMPPLHFDPLSLPVHR